MRDEYIILLSLFTILLISIHGMLEKYCQIRYSQHAMPIPSMNDVKMLQKNNDAFHSKTFQRG